MIIDLETAGTEPGCAILQIGAIADDGRELLANVDPQDSVRLGLTADPSTLVWWVGRQVNLRRPRPVPLAWALKDLFRLWSSGQTVWIRGPDFDMPIIERAARACGLRPPWPFWSLRDVRTAAMAVAVAQPRKRHHALQDCRDDLPIVQRFLRLCHHTREGEL